MLRLHESVATCNRMIEAIEESTQCCEPLPANALVSDLVRVREMLQQLEGAVAIFTGVTP